MAKLFSSVFDLEEIIKDLFHLTILGEILIISGVLNYL